MAKLNFVIPGDKIKLISGVKLIDKRGDYSWEEKVKSLPAGTVLEVSQVYIRKNGWFDSSLTFRIIEGPGLDIAIDAVFKQETKRLKEKIKTSKVLLQRYKKDRADWYAIPSIEGIRSSEKQIPYIGSYQDYKEFEKKDGWTYLTKHKEDIEKEIYISKQAIDNQKRPKISGQEVIRVPLIEIQKWNVKRING